MQALQVQIKHFNDYAIEGSSPSDLTRRNMRNLKTYHTLEVNGNRGSRLNTLSRISDSKNTDLKQIESSQQFVLDLNNSLR